MLYREGTPLTPEEAVDYEIERRLKKFCEDGLVLQLIDEAGGPPRFAKTLRGCIELGDPPAERSFETPYRS